MIALMPLRVRDDVTSAPECAGDVPLTLLPHCCWQRVLEIRYYLCDVTSTSSIPHLLPPCMVNKQTAVICGLRHLVDPLNRVFWGVSRSVLNWLNLGFYSGSWGFLRDYFVWFPSGFVWWPFNVIAKGHWGNLKRNFMGKECIIVSTLN